MKEGYKFIGWNTKVDGSRTQYQVENMFVISENITLFAQWEKNIEPTVPVKPEEPNIPEMPGKPSISDTPATGDNTQMIFMPILLFASLSILHLSSRKKRNL